MRFEDEDYLFDFGHFLQRLPCLYFLQQSFFLAKTCPIVDCSGQTAQLDIDGLHAFTVANVGACF